MATDIEWQHILVTTTEWPFVLEAAFYSYSHRYIFTIYKYTKYDPGYVDWYTALQKFLSQHPT